MTYAAEQWLEAAEAYAEGYHVPAPYHSEGRTLWYVVDPDGDPVEGYETREAAEGARADIVARLLAELRGEVPP